MLIFEREEKRLGSVFLLKSRSNTAYAMMWKIPDSAVDEGFPPPLRGGKQKGRMVPRVSLRFTRGYSPPPLRGGKEMGRLLRSERSAAQPVGNEEHPPARPSGAAESCHGWSAA
jgi:hypothetical protein